MGGPRVSSRGGLTIRRQRSPQAGVEIDLVVEDERGRAHAIEVKVGSTYRTEDARGLRQLRDRVGDRFGAGVLLHLAAAAGTVEDRVHLVPLNQLWTTARDT